MNKAQAVEAIEAVENSLDCETCFKDKCDMCQTKQKERILDTLLSDHDKEKRACSRCEGEITIGICNNCGCDHFLNKESE